jgi:hypothetical protein
MHSYCLPNILSMVFSETVAVRVHSMSLVKRLYKALLKAQAYVTEHTDNVAHHVKELLVDMYWPSTQLALECLAVAKNSDFNYCDHQVREQAFSIHAGPSNTKYPCEDVFGHLTHLVRRSNKGSHKMNKSWP